MALLPLLAVQRPMLPALAKPQIPIGAARRAVFHVEQSRHLLERREVEEVCEVEYDELGQGAFGSVYPARLRVSGAECAIKVVSKSHPEAARWARREAEVMKDLCHEGICKLYEAFEDDENVYLVLELIKGQDLFEELQQCVPDERRAACIMGQVFQALAYCHAPDLAVLHRDIKPENIMLQGTGSSPEAKLVDFGLAVVCLDHVQMAVVGTEAFLAPEALSCGEFSRASDLWSAGVVLHLLLNGGALPCEARSQAWGSSCSTAGSDLIRRLLHRDPSDRLSAADAAAHPWITGEARLEAVLLAPLELVRDCSERCADLSAFDAFDVGEHVGRERQNWATRLGSFGEEAFDDAPFHADIPRCGPMPSRPSPAVRGLNCLLGCHLGPKREEFPAPAPTRNRQNWATRLDFADEACDDAEIQDVPLCGPMPSRPSPAARGAHCLLSLHLGSGSEELIPRVPFRPTGVRRPFQGHTQGHRRVVRGSGSLGKEGLVPRPPSAASSTMSAAVEVSSH